MQLKDIAPSYGLALFIAIPIYLLNYLTLSNWAILPLQLAFGVSIFFLIVRTTKMEEYNEVKGMLKSYVVKIKKK